MNPPKLHAVADSEIPGAVDSWTLPTDLPKDTAIIPRMFLGPRMWNFDPATIILLPMPAQKVEDVVRDYAGFPVLTHNHRKWLLENQEAVPEECKPFHLYFPSDVYVHNESGRPEITRYIYRLVFKNKAWIEEPANFGQIPSVGLGRIIMMR